MLNRLLSGNISPVLLGAFLVLTAVLASAPSGTGARLPTPCSRVPESQVLSVSSKALRHRRLSASEDSKSTVSSKIYQWLVGSTDAEPADTEG